MTSPFTEDQTKTMIGRVFSIANGLTLVALAFGTRMEREMTAAGMPESLAAVEGRRLAADMMDAALAGIEARVRADVVALYGVEDEGTVPPETQPRDDA